MKKIIPTTLLYVISTCFISCYTYEGPVRNVQTSSTSPTSGSVLVNPNAKIPARNTYSVLPTKKEVAPVQTKPNKTEYLNDIVKEIKEKVKEAEVKLVEDSIKVLFPNNIIYPAGSITPNENYRVPITKFIGILNKFNKTEIMIAGHTDNTGNEVKNRKMSKERADKLKEIISEGGVNSNRMSTWGLGSSAPLFDNKTAWGRVKNRRVEFVVLYDE